MALSSGLAINLGLSFLMFWLDSPFACVVPAGLRRTMSKLLLPQGKNKLQARSGEMAGMTNDERRSFYTKALEDQRHLLRSAITAMQKGDLTQALTVATAIRVLVHETARSKPLLKKLRPSFLDLRIPSGRPKVPAEPGATVVYCALAVRVETEEPLISLGNDLGQYEYSTLGSWWNGLALSLPGVGPMSMKELVLGMANKEGAHVDHEMEASYRRLVESKFLFFKIRDMDLGFPNISRLSVGRAGMQMLVCLGEHFPERVDSKRSPPPT